MSRQIAAGVLVRDASGAPRVRTAADAVPALPAAGNGNGSGDLVSRDLVTQLLVGMMQRSQVNPHDTVKDTIEVARLLQTPAQPAVDVESIIERVVTRLGKSGGPREDAFQVYERIDGFLSRFGAKPVTGVVETGKSTGPN